MLISLGILLISAIVIGHSVETNFKKFKWFINQPTLFMIRSLSGDRVNRLNYFDFILIEQYKKIIVNRWGNDFKSKTFSKRKGNSLPYPTDAELLSMVESMSIPMIETPSVVTNTDRKEMELRSEFIRKGGIDANPIERNSDGELINHFEMWKSSKKLKENLS